MKRYILIIFNVQKLKMIGSGVGGVTGYNYKWFEDIVLLLMPNF